MELLSLMEILLTWVMTIWRVVRPCPRMGKESYPVVDKYCLDCIGLT